VHDPERPEDVADSDGPHPRSEDGPQPETPSSVTDAEDEVARAEARAEAARARVMRLRQAAEAEEATDDGAVPVKQRGAKPSRSRRRRLRVPGRKAVGIGAAIVLVCASLAASGYIVWRHYTITHSRQLAAEFAAAARQRVTTLMSMDGQHAKEDIQRLIDSCTGQLKTQLEVQSGLMLSKAEDSKAVSKGTVEAVAVESVSDNSGVVLVAAKTDVTNADNTKRPPALWRLSVNLERDGGQLKMSKVDFLQ
jgi:Mce-associated membrane protein